MVPPVRIEDFYTTAARAGLLIDAEIDGVVHPVDFRTPDADVLDGLGVSRDYQMRFPASWWPGLIAGAAVTIAGITYRIREITATGDGSEHRATLTRR